MFNSASFFRMRFSIRETRLCAAESIERRSAVINHAEIIKELSKYSFHSLFDWHSSGVAYAMSSLPPLTFLLIPRSKEEGTLISR